MRWWCSGRDDTRAAPAPHAQPTLSLLLLIELSRLVMHSIELRPNTAGRLC